MKGDGKMNATMTRNTNEELNSIQDVLKTRGDGWYARLYTDKSIRIEMFTLVPEKAVFAKKVEQILARAGVKAEKIEYRSRIFRKGYFDRETGKRLRRSEAKNNRRAQYGAIEWVKEAIVKKYTKVDPVCTCREPKTHRDCFYCGNGWNENVCGVCYDAGIDGRLIRGTGRKVCAKHKKGETK